jgi:hypothetical protein
MLILKPGFTSTGATTISNLDQLPGSINVWRAFLVWIGGMGVVVLAVAALPMLGAGVSQALKAKPPGSMRGAKLTPRIAQTAKGLWAVYVLLTAACTLGLCPAGMPLLESLINTFSFLDLGSFSPHDASFGFFDSPAMEAIAIVFMLLGISVPVRCAHHVLHLAHVSKRMRGNDCVFSGSSVSQQHGTGTQSSCPRNRLHGTDRFSNLDLYPVNVAGSLGAIY